jgi:hypothetical protein
MCHKNDKILPTMDDPANKAYTSVRTRPIPACEQGLYQRANKAYTSVRTRPIPACEQGLYQRANKAYTSVVNFALALWFYRKASLWAENCPNFSFFLFGPGNLNYDKPQGGPLGRKLSQFFLFFCLGREN